MSRRRKGEGGRAAHKLLSWVRGVGEEQGSSGKGVHPLMLSNEMFRVAHDDYFWHLWQMCGKRNEFVCVCVLPLSSLFFAPPSLLQFIYKQSKSSPFNCSICQTKSILIAFSCWHFECHERGAGRGGVELLLATQQSTNSFGTKLAWPKLK